MIVKKVIYLSIVLSLILIISDHIYLNSVIFTEKDNLFGNVITRILRGVSLPGIEFNHTQRNLENGPVEVGILKTNLNEGIEIAVMVNDDFNKRLYADRKNDRLILKGKEDLGIGDMEIIRKKMQTIEGFIKDYEKEHEDKEVIAAIPASNVLWNDWFIAYSEGKLFHRFGEPVEERSYSMFVMREDGSASIENLRFEQDGEEWIVKNKNDEDITDEVKYATFGQQILKDSDVEDITEISHQWDDLRHLILFPELRLKHQDLPYPDEKGRGIFTFGQGYLLGHRKKRENINKAIKGKVIGVSTKDLKKYVSADLDKDVSELTKEDIKNTLAKNLTGYTEVSSENKLQRGRGQYYVESADSVKIRFKQGPFSHTAIGVTDDGKVITVLISKTDVVGGATIKEVAEILKEQGAIRGLLLCNGLDVVMNWQGQRIFRGEEELFGRRDKFSSVILYVKDRD